MKIQDPQKPLLLFLFLLFRKSLANTSTQTITNVVAFQNLDGCAQSCFQYKGGGCTWGVMDSTILGCAKQECFSELAVNDCYCRTDKQSVATAYLSSCISKACTVGDPMIDVSSGVGIYEGYCTSLGYLAPAAPVNVEATTTAAAGNPAIQTGTGSTSTGPIQTSSCVVGSLSCVAVGGISVGSIAGLVAAVGGIFKTLDYFKKKKNKTYQNPVNHFNFGENSNFNLNGSFQTLKS